MGIKKKLVAKKGTYPGEGGTTKSRGATLGFLCEGKYGDFILLDPLVNLAALPREPNQDKVIVNLYDYEPRQDGAGAIPHQDVPQESAPEQGLPF